MTTERTPAKSSTSRNCRYGSARRSSKDTTESTALRTPKTVVIWLWAMTSAIAPKSRVVLKLARLRARSAVRATEMKTTRNSALVKYRTSSAALIATTIHAPIDPEVDE
jgi:hypothetical protein